MSKCPSETFIREEKFMGYRCDKKIGHWGVHRNRRGKVQWTDQYLEWDFDKSEYKSTAGL